VDILERVLDVLNKDTTTLVSSLQDVFTCALADNTKSLVVSHSPVA
jgi:hypothetical protein